jgi:hypothetical protein
MVTYLGNLQWRELPVEFHKILLVGSRCVKRNKQTDRQTDRQTQMTAFWATAPCSVAEVRA